MPGRGGLDVSEAVTVSVTSEIGLSDGDGLSDAVNVVGGVIAVVLVPVGVIKRGVGEYMIGVEVGIKGRGDGIVYSHPLQEERKKNKVDKMMSFFIEPPYQIIVS